jgi:hypothetical protein
MGFPEALNVQYVAVACIPTRDQDRKAKRSVIRGLDGVIVHILI